MEKHVMLQKDFSTVSQQSPSRRIPKLLHMRSLAAQSLESQLAFLHAVLDSKKTMGHQVIQLDFLQFKCLSSFA